jgi:hypothetical protein
VNMTTGTVSLRRFVSAILLSSWLAMCVPAEVPLPSSQQLAWTKYEVSMMISYDMITQLPGVPNPQVRGSCCAARPGFAWMRLLCARYSGRVTAAAPAALLH